jgi:hypothetical protein
MSQSTMILRALQKSRGKRVSTVSLAGVSGSHAVHSRINDLRKYGHNIECIPDIRNPKRAWYTLY